MIETKVSLSLQVPSACMLSQQEAENKPKESYDEHRVVVTYPIGNGKNKKIKKETISFKTRKQKLITQIINMTKEAYESMLDTPTSPKFSRKVNGKSIWSTMAIDARLKKHFDQIASDLNAVSYSYKVFED